MERQTQRVETPDAAYELALRFVEQVDRDLAQGTGHYRDNSGRLLRHLGQVVDAALRDELAEGGYNGSRRLEATPVA
jgi:hypothetical protein